jgi:hypothetical protein
MLAQDPREFVAALGGKPKAWAPAIGETLSV